MEKSEKTQNIVAGILAALVLALLTAMAIRTRSPAGATKLFRTCSFLSLYFC